MEKSQQWLGNVRLDLEKAVSASFSQYKEGKELQEGIEKWQEKIINAASFGYVYDVEVLESYSKAKQALTKLDKKYKNFLKEYEVLGNHAKIILGIESRNYGINDVDKSIDQINDILHLSIKKVEKSKSNFQEKGMKVNATRKPLFGLLSTLYEAYQDISGRELKISFNQIEGTVSGNLYNFLKPFLDIVEPNINQETLKSSLKDSIEWHKKLPQG